LKTVTPALIRHALATTLIAASTWAGAQSLDIRPGGWNLTMSLSINGAAPRVSPLKSCVTKEELQRDQAFQQDNDCIRKISARTPSRIVGTMTCRSDDMQMQGEFEMVAASPESVMMKTTTKGIGKAVGTIESRMEIKGRWASASCKGYDD
jgi:hypothetical protein